MKNVRLLSKSYATVTARWMDRQTDRQMDEQTDRWMDGGREKWMDIQNPATPPPRSTTEYVMF